MRIPNKEYTHPHKECALECASASAASGSAASAGHAQCCAEIGVLWLFIRLCVVRLVLGVLSLHAKCVLVGAEEGEVFAEALQLEADPLEVWSKPSFVATFVRPSLRISKQSPSRLI